MESGFLSRDLAIIIIAIGMATLVCAKLRLPSLLGFIVVGMMIDPIFKLIKDHMIIMELGELGILFMMFFVGMEFNLGKLRKVMTPATSAIILQTICMGAIGVFGAKVLGMPSIAGLFLGGLLSISSTIVFIEIISARGDLNKKYALLATGILILEDLLAILMLVFLSGIAISKTVEWAKLWHVCFMLATFVVAMFAAGKVFLQPLLRKMSLNSSGHVVMIFALAMIFGLGELAAELNFSIALGAFLAGSILAGTPIATQIEEIITPFKNLFVALFFVSVGMMMNPMQVIELAIPIFILSGCVLIGQSMSCFLGASLAGTSPRVAWLAGINKARIGEFSFVIAALGMKLGVVDSSIASIAMGVAFVTIFVNPLISSQGVKIANFVEKYAPQKIKSGFEVYDNLLKIAHNNLNTNKLIMNMRGEIAEAFIYFLLFNAVLFSATFLSGLNYIKELPHCDIAITIIWFLAGILILPFWVAILKKISTLIDTFLTMTLRASMRRYIETFSRVFKYAGGLIVSIFLLSIYLTAAGSQLSILATLLFMAAALLIVGVVFYRNFTQINTRLEYAFIENFNRNLENDSEFRREKLRENILNKYPWPIDIAELVIERGSIAVGKTISELAVRKETGVNVVAIEHESYVRYDITPHTVLYAGDLLVIIGSAEQIKNATEMLAKKVSQDSQDSSLEQPFKISYLIAGINPDYADKTLFQLDLPRRFSVSIIGIQRGQTRITSPGANELMKPDDILLVMGRDDDVQRLSMEIER